LVSGALILIGICGCSHGGSTGTGPRPDSDRVWIDRIGAAPGEQVKLNISFSNSRPLMGVSLPLKYYGNGCFIESVSFVGSRLENAALSITDIDTAGQTISVIAGDTLSIDQGSGLLAGVYIKLTESPEIRQIIFDTTTIDLGGMNQFLAFVVNTSYFYFPSFTPGLISVGN
jgi:hypothetical protein